MRVLLRRHSFILLWSVLAVFYAFFLLQRIDLAREDLGRHIMNGRLVFQDSRILTQNFFSYTMPDTTFLNHHWLSGVVYDRVVSAVGIRGLILGNVVMLLGMLGILLRMIHTRGGSYFWTFVWGLAAVMLLSTRHVVRPEYFSFFFIAVYLWLGRKVELEENISPLLVIGAAVLQIVWTNLHILFFFGPLIVFTAVFSRIAKRRSIRGISKTLITLLAGMFLAVFVNPQGIRTVLYPLRIFSDYGYQIVENVPPFELRWLFPQVYVFLIIAMVSISLLCIRLIFLHNFRWSDVIYAAIGTVLASLALRNIPLFGLFVIPVAAESCVKLVDSIQRKIHLEHDIAETTKVLAWVMLPFVSVLWMFYVVMGQYDPAQTYRNLFPDDIEQQLYAGKFFRELNIEGAMFNNYDVGSYLIYTLFPKWRVFVDNRPEAYSTAFFQELYIPMQENDDVWQEALKTYDFRTIYFDPRDFTPWAQKFILSRLNDPDWKVVLLEKNAIIFLRNLPEYQEKIRMYEVPRERILEYYKMGAAPEGSVSPP